MRIKIKTKPKKKLEDIITKSKWYYVNNNLTTDNFPHPDVVETNNWKILTMPKSYFTSQEALDEIKRQGYRPANAWELAKWANNHREEVSKRKWYLALGQLWYGGGGHRVPYVLADSDGDFEFDLGYFGDGWSGDDCLLCFCDPALDTLEAQNALGSLALETRVKELEDKMTKLQKFLILE